MSDLRMPELNRVTMAGRLGRDPELKYTTGGKPNCKFAIAVSKRWKPEGASEWKEDTFFIDVVVWGAYAEAINNKLCKGTAVIVEGRLHLNEWQGRDGETKKRFEIMADRVQPLEWTNDHSGGGQPRNEHAATAAGARKKADEAPPEDDLPF